MSRFYYCDIASKSNKIMEIEVKKGYRYFILESEEKFVSAVVLCYWIYFDSKKFKKL